VLRDQREVVRFSRLATALNNLVELIGSVVSTCATVHAPTPPAGSVEVITFPSPSNATHSRTDGHCIWESAPYYERPHADIAALFDTAYVSLYKGLGGFAGSLLAGREELVAHARVWRRRHGGAPSNLFPFAAAAQRGLDFLVPQMPRFLEHARALAAALGDVPGVAVVPDPPQTPLFHVHLRGERDALQERALAVARERRVWLFNRIEPSVMPGINKVEVNIGEPALDISPPEAAELFAAVTAG
jgi:hypothetical protein